MHKFPESEHGFLDTVDCWSWLISIIVLNCVLEMCIYRDSASLLILWTFLCHSLVLSALLLHPGLARRTKISTLNVERRRRDGTTHHTSPVQVANEAQTKWSISEE